MEACLTWRRVYKHGDVSNTEAVRMRCIGGEGSGGSGGGGGRATSRGHCAHEGAQGLPLAPPDTAGVYSRLRRRDARRCRTRCRHARGAHHPGGVAPGGPRESQSQSQSQS
eukprot:1848388-Pyramimonas_sp.AAC.1